MKQMKIKLDEGAFMPVRAHATDAGLDLKTPFEFFLDGNESITIDTGVHIELPHGYYGKIESKSGLNVNFGIVCCGGTIDEGYTGSIAVKLYNLEPGKYHFNAGDKIAQLVIQRYLAPELKIVEDLEQTERGDNGFGSTGK